METTAMAEPTLTEKLQTFRRLTGLSYEKIGRAADVSGRWVWSVANPKPGQVFEEEESKALRDYLDAHLRELIADASAVLGEDDPIVEELVTRLGAKRPT